MPQPTTVTADRLVGPGFHGGEDDAEPVSGAGRGAEFLGNMVHTLRRRTSVLRPDAAANENEGSDCDRRQRRRGRERV